MVGEHPFPLTGFAVACLGCSLHLYITLLDLQTKPRVRVRVNIVEVKEDFTLRSSRDGHLSSSCIPPTLFLYLHRLQVHLTVVFCTFDHFLHHIYHSVMIGMPNRSVLSAASFVYRGAKAKLHQLSLFYNENKKRRVDTIQRCR